MNITKRLVAICVVTQLSGCAIFYKDYGVGPLTVDQDSTSLKLIKAIQKTSDTDTAHLVSQVCFNVPVPSANAAECQQQRNAAIATLLNASDDLCQAHLKTIFGNDASFNIVTGSITSLAAGWATITNGASAKSAMSAVAAFSNAERSLVNETVYKNMVVTAVTKKIREARDTKAAAIIPGNFAKTINAYPMLMGIYDVIGYHYTCSFMFGLEKALEEGTQSTIDSKKAKLEQDKQMLELYLDNRKRVLKAASPGLADAEINKDPGIAGANSRIAALEERLLVLIRTATLPTLGAPAAAPPIPAPK